MNDRYRVDSLKCAISAVKAPLPQRAYLFTEVSGINNLHHSDIFLLPA